jgi:hypothetical protein
MLSQIPEHIVVDEKKFRQATKPKSYFPSTAYLSLCIFLAFLIMVGFFFYFYHFVDGAAMEISLNYALLDSALSAISLLINFFAFVLLIHVSAKALGATKNLQKTFQVHAYAYTPSFLFGWLYIFGSFDSIAGIALWLAGVFFSLLAVINGMIGLKSIHKLTPGKAFIAEFVVPLLAFLAFGILVAMYGIDLGL